MTRVQLEDGLYNLLQPQLGMTTLWAHQGGDAAARMPDKPLVLLNIVSDLEQGLPDGYGDAQLVGSDYLERLTEDRVLRLSLRAFGAGGFDVLNRLTRYFRTTTGQLATNAAGFGLLSATAPTNVAQLSGAGWEELVTMDLRLHYRAAVETDEGYLDRVEIGVTYTDAGGATVGTDTIIGDVNA